MPAPVDAKKESRSIDFKSAFDPANTGDWCELIKDLVAMANSGGGTLLIGVADDGQPATNPNALRILRVDPAVFTDKIAKYTGVQFDSFTIDLGRRSRPKVAMITVGHASPPMMFEKPGAYISEHGQSKMAFAAGTLYLRHGAKSEPAGSADIARLMERNVQRARKEWLSGVRKVTNAPAGATIAILPPKVTHSDDPAATPIRITNNPAAPEYQLIDPDKTHPWRQKELLNELNKSLPGKINPYDLLAVRRLHAIDDDANFVHKSRFGSTQYSPYFAKWLLEQHSSDPRFFEKSRSVFNPIGNVHTVDDKRLRWLVDFMQTNGISMSGMARRLKIGNSTLSRLVAGKYNGDVPRMLERIDAYRRSTEE